MNAEEPAVVAYRRQLDAWASALAAHDPEAVAPDAADGFTADDVGLFTDGNLDKRFAMLQRQAAFLRPAFDDLDERIEAFIASGPMPPYATGPSDGAAFLRWLRAAGGLTLEQGDRVACRLARYAVEDAARADRRAHLRFQEWASVAPGLAADLPRNRRLRLHLNPARAWSRFETAKLLGDDAELPADVLFFAVGTELRTALLAPPAPALLIALAEVAPCPLATWAVHTATEPEELAILAADLAGLGLVAFS
jgi:hypothetical protein